MLWVDGLYDASKEVAQFHLLPIPTDEEIRELVETLSKRILKMLKRKGYPVDEESEVSAEENETFLDFQGASVAGLIALG